MNILQTLRLYCPLKSSTTITTTTAKIIRIIKMMIISARRPDLILINKRKVTCKIVDFAVPADHRIKLKECEKKDKDKLGD